MKACNGNIANGEEGHDGQEERGLRVNCVGCFRLQQLVTRGRPGVAGTERSEGPEIRLPAKMIGDMVFGVTVRQDPLLKVAGMSVGTAPPRSTTHRFNLVQLAAFSIIYHSKLSLVFFVDGIHRNKFLTTAMSFLVTYTSLGRTAPNQEKGKDKGKGEKQEKRHKTRFENPSVLDSDEVGQIHESICKGCVDLICPHKIDVKGEYEKEYMVQDLLLTGFLIAALQRRETGKLPTGFSKQKKEPESLKVYRSVHRRKIRQLDEENHCT
ncbi:hypothetical protein K435DRAFT_808232 [Dendrothele bispora CBS 962.96]|uniref:Uncharacterized protein n=1 Tax=Dendrothele bispora (strain CBS 962.96) TaxID=1314807 RepID=A0A4S8L261_DENBC|nr:hypothetical protein K435DRAFT_808232 [Dendrothele bispora CBS 962.96]